MKILDSVGTIVSMRALNILGNAAAGVVLARKLSLSDRGYVAAISSVIGIAIILISSPKGENILRNRQETWRENMPRKITFHLWQFVIVSLVSLGYFFFASDLKLNVLTCSLICLLIYSSSINSLKQAFMFHKFGTFGHQLVLTSHSITYAFCLFLAFTFLDSSVNMWLLAFLLTDFLLFVVLQKINNDISIDFKFNPVSTNQREFSSSKISVIERISVYQAAFYIQLTIIFASLFYSADSLAYFAIGMSLATLIALPLAPFLPKVISNSKELVKEFQSLNTKKLLLILIGTMFYLFGAAEVFQIFIPIMYGPKYYLLVESVPVIVLCGFMISCFSIIGSLLRGLRKHLQSVFISTFGLFSFFFGLAIMKSFDHGIYQTFLLLLTSNLISLLLGIVILSSQKVFNI